MSMTSVPQPPVSQTPDRGLVLATSALMRVLHEMTGVWIDREAARLIAAVVATEYLRGGRDGGLR